MVVCGDDTLAHRLAAELRGLYGETVTLVVPGPGRDTGQPATGRARTSMLFGRISAAVTRAAGGAGAATAGSNGSGGSGAGGSGAGSAGAVGPGAVGFAGQGVQAADRIVEAPELTEEVLAEAGVEHAAALALVHDDDETNIRAALAARRLNPRLRLVIRLYNRRLGQYLEDLLDQAAALAAPGMDATELDASTTVLSDADTAAPALAATAIAGSSKVVRAGGLLLRAAEVDPGHGEVAEQGLCTLALLSSTAADPAGAEGSDISGTDGPMLLPDEESVAAAPGRGTVVLRTLAHTGPAPARGRRVPLGWLLSRRLRWSFTVLVGAVLALAVASMLTTGDHPLHAIYLTVLDLLAINDPATDGPAARQILQLLSGVVGLLLLPVLLAAVLEALGSFRSGPVARRPPRGLSDHVVLLGLGKIGTRVLLELRKLNIPVVCVEADPEARGLAVARRLRVPVVLGDVTEEGVLEAAKIHRAGALLALTSLDTINLEAALTARSVKPQLRVVLRLYDDDFATVVYRTLRAAHPGALTRSRSVSHLAAPAFAGAMMGRQILGAIPVERRVLLFAVVDVAGHPLLEGRTIGQAFRPGQWRILALAAPDTAERPASADRTPDLVWDLDPKQQLGPGDRVVLAATRQGLAELLKRRARGAGTP
ncbi:potassium transporter TrkA [Streptomyces sulfonofaciens]|uniref:Potassium transporter TrkA n=1 Tax=Streptomyces sulfonofaciens TaxID=68272 RepID=A0A919FP00_9ACTN|nr:NAD-binding protein [Streptomyces sulfonofaciens]GHH69228.1 potassium transporter TrkA [Streptomyces sulfonofaciens]